MENRKPQQPKIHAGESKEFDLQMREFISLVNSVSAKNKPSIGLAISALLGSNGNDKL